DANEVEAIEATGKNVDEAIENGLVDLDLKRHEVDVEVLSEGRAGLFGIGGEPAKVRLTPATAPATMETPEGDDIAFVEETLETIFEMLDVDASVEMRPPETPGDGVGLVRAVADVTGEDLGVLIGRRGSTMASLQYIVNLMVSRRFKDQAPFTIDVEGYRRRREDSLQDLAFRMAEEVRESGRPVTLEAMPAYERRIIHLALAKDPTVATASVGEGDARKVRISTQQ
ncbi:MAG: protein jag, partial [Chloroflexi bacterium]|nr:protein jag [Chloroflexota bacterium]